MKRIALVAVGVKDRNRILIGGKTGYATGNLADGQVTIKLPTLSGAGTYPVRARVTDLADNEGTSPTRNVVVENRDICSSVSLKHLRNPPPPCYRVA